MEGKEKKEETRGFKFLQCCFVRKILLKTKVEWISENKRKVFFFLYFQIIRNLHIERRKWNEWNVLSSCPTHYSNKGLMSARCVGSHRDCHQVHIKIKNYKSMWYHPVGCVHALRVSVQGVRQRDPRVTK